MFNRAEVVDENFTRFLKDWDGVGVAERDPADSIVDDSSLTGRDAMEIMESQMSSRHLDFIARELRTTNQSFYTIGSSGHEGDAVVGRLTRHTDPAFLHYRCGGFMAQRSRKVPEVNFLRDTVLGQVASEDDPIAGGRHKVWGSKTLWVPPQTSTIASHLPKAVGTAMAIGRAKRLKLPLPFPPDSIVVCSFGDASTQHASCATAINGATYASYSQVPVPILFLCEDNGIGISVHTKAGWVEKNYSVRANLKYFQANGLNVAESYPVVERAVNYCRAKRVPVFLHLKTVRLLGHAGSDFEPEYHTIEQIEANEAKDPLLATARVILDAGVATAAELLDLYESIRGKVHEEAAYCVERPKLTSAAKVIEPLAPHHPDRVREEVARTEHERRVKVFGGEDRLPEKGPARHMAVQINRAMFDLMAKYDEIAVFGEDVAQKGGVYNLTAGLYKQFGVGRVFNSMLDETMILGLAQGFGTVGMLPMPEIQYLAYFHNAEDQIRGEACSLQFFSNDQFRNPMVVRIASLGYQKGFGGHFHNDNSVAVLRDIPGLVVAIPSRGDDAVQMLRTAVALARVNGRVVVFLEPIALYMTKDLHADKDGGWQTDYPPPECSIPVGEPRVYNPETNELVIITYANGAYFSVRVAKRLEDEHGIKPRIVDLRWLSPLNTEAIAKHARECGRVLIVDEGRRSGGVGEAVIAAIVEHCDAPPRMRLVAGMDTYIPLGPAAPLVVPSEQQIFDAAVALCSR